MRISDAVRDAASDLGRRNSSGRRHLETIQELVQDQNPTMMGVMVQGQAMEVAVTELLDIVQGLRTLQVATVVESAIQAVDEAANAAGESRSVGNGEGDVVE